MSENFEYNDSAEYGPSEWSGENSEAWGDSSEAWGEARRRSAPVRTAPRQSAYSPRPSGAGAPVTQAQLQAALARVSQQIGVNSTAIKTVDGRMRSLSTEQDRLQASVKKDMAERKKELETVRRELQSTRELSALIPMIAPPGTKLGSIAPLLHLVPGDILGTTLGGSSSGSGAPGGSNLLAIAAIALASGAFK